MINVTAEQRNLLLEHLPNAEELMKSDDVNDLLLPLDDLIMDIGFDEDYELTPIGLKLQLAYDQIFNQND